MAISAEYFIENKHGNTPAQPKPLEGKKNLIQVGQRQVEVELMPLSEMIIVPTGSGVTMKVQEDPDRQTYRFTDDDVDSLTLRPGETALLTYQPEGHHAIPRTIVVKTFERQPKIKKMMEAPAYEPLVPFGFTPRFQMGEATGAQRLSELLRSNK